MASRNNQQQRQVKAARLKRAELLGAIALALIGVVLGAVSAQAKAIAGIAFVAFLLLFHLALKHRYEHSLRQWLQYPLSLLLAGASAYGLWHFYLNDQYQTQQASKTEGDLVAEDADSESAARPPVLQIGPDEHATKFTLGGGPRTSSLFFSYIDDVQLVIQNGPSGVVLSTPVLDSKGNKVGEITKNHWKIFPPWASDKNYDKHSLEILDTAGDVVLQVRLRKNVAELQGFWRDESGKGLEIYDVPGKGGRMYFAPVPDKPRDRYKIPKMFVYPSSAHWGERVSQP
jgi:hypothetical protein